MPPVAVAARVLGQSDRKREQARSLANKGATLIEISLACRCFGWARNLSGKKATNANATPRTPVASPRRDGLSGEPHEPR